MNLSERRRHPRWSPERAHVHMYVRGGQAHRCRVCCISRAGMFIETDSSLPVGAAVELGITYLHTRQLVKLYRRSAYVARASKRGVAVLFLRKLAQSA